MWWSRLPSPRRLKDAPTHPHLAAHQQTHTSPPVYSQSHQLPPIHTPHRYAYVIRKQADVFHRGPAGRGALLWCWMKYTSVHAPASPVSWWLVFRWNIYQVLSRPNLNAGLVGLRCTAGLSCGSISFYIWGSNIGLLSTNVGCKSFKVE